MSPDRPGRAHNSDAEEDVCAHATSNDRLDARMGNIRGRCAKSRIDSLSAENARNRLLEKASHRRAHCRTSFVPHGGREQVGAGLDAGSSAAEKQNALS